MRRLGAWRRDAASPWVAAAIGAAVFSLGGCSLNERAFAPQLAPSPQLARSGRALDLMPSPGRQGATEVRPRQEGEGGVSPDGEWVASVSGRGAARTFTVARRDGSRTVLRLRGSESGLLPAWAPTGARLAFVRRQSKRAAAWDVCVLNPDTARVAKIGGAVGSEPPAVSWFSDGRRLAYGNGSWLIVADAEAQAVRAVQVPDAGGRVTGSPAVSPDGKYVVFAVADAGVWIVSVADGRLARVTSDGDVDGLAWAPGGREIALRTASDGRWRVRVLRALDFGGEDPKPAR